MDKVSQVCVNDAEDDEDDSDGEDSDDDEDDSDGEVMTMKLMMIE